MVSETRTARARRSSSVVHTLFDGAGVVRVKANNSHPSASTSSQTTLLSKFIASQKDLENYRAGKPVKVDGETLSIAAVTAAARYHASVQLDQSAVVRERIDKSRKYLSDKVDNGISIYGVSTGFGGSADTRTDSPLVLGHALLQMQHAGVLPSSTKPLEALPLLDPIGSTVMPEAWVRAAILIRMNSLIRGHSGVRYELIERMNQLLYHNITPFIPLRGSISASGDLSPLSYIAGTLCGNPSIRVFDGPASFGARQIVSSRDALTQKNIEPLALASKEHLGILNGTAFSAAVASLALNDAVHLTLLTQVCTAMGVEALKGNRASFDPFIHNVARPHPGQVECAKIIWDLLEGSKLATLHEEEVTIEEDEGTLRQDRYSLRTAPQFIGPQIEDLLASLATITQECNSTTDNPLIDGETGKVHHGGNFQAMAVTNAMEKTRLSLHHLGKILFAQCAELMDNSMNRGLPPNLAATDPSLNYFGKGIDIATAAYVGELGYLAAPVSTHIQSAEMHNQAVNSLALISGRATINSLEVLSILIASYLYALCQAMDLRALEAEFKDGARLIICEELSAVYSDILSCVELGSVTEATTKVILASWDTTSTFDATERMQKMGSSSSTTLLDFFTREKADDVLVGKALAAIPKFRQAFAIRATSLLDELRRAYLTGERGPDPASSILNRTRPVYEFVRKTLGIKMSGAENYMRFPNGHGLDAQTSGQDISLIHEAIRDGRIQNVIVNMFP
ncbi:phenylalanine ammonium lyase [Moniliophthora roreri MCA 2997]|uniref:Phenylalanine ammonium lyase n=1 Tax=Moniliophthora roreri (strain MCA 2997) TaxID=1381753 RepID=V2YK35_MONRO|nr:phenylalanine ammonium lyase [Moniliophthora roreri MCA 2997]KAI3609483.1 phenylalanine ammonium lyase [Moniliophthora roreri]